MAIDQKDFDRLMNQARVELTGASDAGIKGKLFDVLDEFFTDSNAWNEHISFNILAATQDYTLIPQYGGMIKRLVTVYDQNHITYPAFIECMEPPNAVLHLTWPQNSPFSAKAVVIKTVVLPTNTKDVPDAPRWLLPMYERVILAGVLGTMMNQQSKSYSDAKNGAYHLKKFRDGIMTARVAAERGNLYGGQSWRFPRNFAGRGSQRGGVSTPFPSASGW